MHEHCSKTKLIKWRVTHRMSGHGSVGEMSLDRWMEREIAHLVLNVVNGGLSELAVARHFFRRARKKKHWEKINLGGKAKLHSSELAIAGIISLIASYFLWWLWGVEIILVAVWGSYSYSILILFLFPNFFPGCQTGLGFSCIHFYPFHDANFPHMKFAFANPWGQIACRQ